MRGCPYKNYSMTTIAKNAVKAIGSPFVGITWQRIAILGIAKSVVIVKIGACGTARAATSVLMG
jgi:hypothetical protein